MVLLHAIITLLLQSEIPPKRKYGILLIFDSEILVSRCPEQEKSLITFSFYDSQRGVTHTFSTYFQIHEIYLLLTTLHSF